MSSYLFCLTASGGVPIFSRNKGDLPQLPFPVVGSLNGVHMFSNSHDVQLKSTTTDDAKIVWKTFNDSITLIIVTKDDRADDCHLDKLLDTIFQCIVLLCGIDEIETIKSVEKLKREVRVCFPLIDIILEQADNGLCADVANAVETMIIPESLSANLQNFLEGFCEASESPYGCVLVRGRIIVASQKWWNLSATELIILQLLQSSLDKCTARDIPVYLPKLSPSVPHRLMIFQLMKDIEVCVICGPKPPMKDLVHEVLRFWRPSLDNLRAALKLSPRNIPSTTSVDSNILGFLLVNTDNNRCVSSVNPQGVDDSFLGTMNSDRRTKALRSFYKHVVGNFFCSTTDGSDIGPSEFSHKPTETYVAGDSYKCYAMTTGSYQLYVLYNTDIPTFAMRNVTQKTLHVLTKDRHVVV